MLEKVTPVSLLAIEIIVNNLKKALTHPDDLSSREALGLGTDLGGFAIMIGGTNGAHLTSFSLVDILSHGRACALMNPYYTVLFSTAIAPQLRAVGAIFQRAGYTEANLENLKGIELGIAVAQAMFAFSKDIGFPTMLSQVPGFTRSHIDRALAAAKNPQLESKLRNMPVPLTSATVDEYMGPVLNAAVNGDLSLIKTLE
jgi:alcohol dehydrogenase class IV